MRPFAALLAIVTGSAVSLAVGLVMTFLVILFMPAHTAIRLAPERAPLVQGIMVFTLLSAASAGSLYAEMRERRWRWLALAAMVGALAFAVWLYWPRD